MFAATRVGEKEERFSTLTAETVAAPIIAYIDKVGHCFDFDGGYVGSVTRSGDAFDDRGVYRGRMSVSRPKGPGE